MRPGMTVLPASDTRSTPAGTVTRAAGPTAEIRPSRTRMVAFSIGARSVPSMTRAPVNALTAPGACARRAGTVDTVARDVTRAAAESARVRGRFMATI